MPTETILVVSSSKHQFDRYVASLKKLLPVLALQLVYVTDPMQLVGRDPESTVFVEIGDYRDDTGEKTYLRMEGCRRYHNKIHLEKI